MDLPRAILVASLALGLLAPAGASAAAFVAGSATQIAAVDDDEDDDRGVEIIRGGQRSAPTGHRGSRRATDEDRAPHGSVVMYGATWCGYCAAARAYFDRHSIPYTEYDVEKSARGRRDYQQLGGGGLPIIQVGDSSLRGFDAARFSALYYGR